MMYEKKEKEPILTKQDLKDFLIAAALVGGLEVMLKGEGDPLTGGEIAIGIGLWGGVIGYLRGRKDGRNAGIRAGAASAAGSVVGNICGYLINNYQMFM